MGLFDNVGNSFKSGVALDAKSALALAGLAMIAADGEFEQEEISALLSISAVNANAVDQAIKAFKKLDTEEIISATKEVLSENQRMVTLIVMLDIAMADGHLAGDEKSLFTKFQSGYDVSDADMADALEVIAIKNNPSTFA